MTERARPFLLRVWNTAVFWTWMFNVLRLASGVLLVPLLLHFLSDSDLGMYYNFLYYTGFLLSFDSMFSVTITRAIGYALRGVTSLPAMGIATLSEDNLPPNIPLLSQVLGATRRLYAFLASGIVLLLGLGGTLMLLPLFAQTSDPRVAWTAWALMICSAALELYTGYWLVFLRGTNQVVLSARLSTVIYGTKLLLSCTLLIGKFGLMAVPIAGMVSGILQRVLARHFTMRCLPAGTRIDTSNSRAVLKNLWPNSWRLGLILVSGNVMMAGFGAVISRKLGLPANTRFGISQQVICGICFSMASVWTLVKWPMVVQLRATNDCEAMQRLLWPRIWLKLGTYAFLVTGFIIAGPQVLKWIAPSKELLDTPWLIVMAVWGLFEIHYTFWTTLISTENRIPSLWAAVITNIVNLIAATLLLNFTRLGLGSFVLAPLVTGLALNYWHWAREGARSIGTTWFHFMFTRPAPRMARPAEPAPSEPSGVRA